MFNTELESTSFKLILLNIFRLFFSSSLFFVGSSTVKGHLPQTILLISYVLFCSVLCQLLLLVQWENILYVNYEKKSE